MKCRSAYILMLSVSALWTGCGAPPEHISGKKADQMRQENALLRRQRDSLQNLLNPQDHTAVKEQPVVPGDQPATAKEPPPAPVASGSIRPGKHYFTLQWISWITPGSVMISPAGAEWYNIQGEQQNAKNNDRIIIRGRIKQLSASELQFEGEIISVVAANNKGQPCVKRGPQVFKASGKRKYWRLQDMKNCEGGMLTDYVDIYF